MEPDAQVSKTVWIVRGEQVGLCAPERDAFVERWQRSNDPRFAMQIGFPSTPSSPRAMAMPPITREQREHVYEGFTSGVNKLFEIRTLEDERCIGDAYLFDIGWPRASAEFAIAIYDTADRGMGYGGEVGLLLCAYGFDGLGLHRIVHRYLASSPAAVRATEKQAQKVGARLVGVEREAAWAFGGWQDIMLVETLASQFPPHPATAYLRLRSDSAASPSDDNDRISTT